MILVYIISLALYYKNESWFTISEKRNYEIIRSVIRVVLILSFFIIGYYMAGKGYIITGLLGFLLGIGLPVYHILEIIKRKKQEQLQKQENEIGDKDAEGQYLFGCMFFDKKEYVEAEYWWKKASENGNIDAEYALGDLFCYKKEFEEAKYWWNKAAEKGHSEAIYRLNNCEYL